MLIYAWIIILLYNMEPREDLIVSEFCNYY